MIDTPARNDEDFARLGTDIQRRIGVKTSRHEPLARFTTMRVGGPADLFAEIHNLFELRAIVRFARTRELPVFILGRGSDLVISDKGIRGLVVHNRAQQVRFEGNRLTADSGLPMARAATLCRAEGLSGLEFGLAIPGTVGGAVWANAGAHESDVAQVIVAASVLRSDGTEETLDTEGLQLAYRESVLKHAPTGNPDVVTWATFELESAESDEIGRRLDEIRKWRQAHQPLGMPSAGSVFRNPSESVSAGALIDGLGLKGTRIGGAVVSEKHANFIVNDESGTASDVRSLGEMVRETVRSETGHELVFEIMFAGDWSGWEIVKPTSIAVVLGGPSAEHDVSLVSGRAIAAALAERGHDVHGWLVDLDGLWWRLPPAAMGRELLQSAYDDPASLGASEPMLPGRAVHAIRELDPTPVVFIALHGPFGEDGTAQALCESANLVYTGAGVAASAIGMDKTIFKRLAGGLGMPVVPWVDIHSAEWQQDPVGAQRRVSDFAASLPDPRVVVKPTRLGSSVGISIVHKPQDPEYTGGAITEALSYGDSVLVEAYLEHARELEMSVLGNSEMDLESYGPGEIFPGHEFYDFTAKYDEGVSRTTDRPEVEPQLKAQIHDIARRAYLAIGTEGFARVDFLVDKDGALYLNEINTIPGFTPISLFPVLCREGGYDFGAISEKIVELALERARSRPRRTLTRADLP